MRNVIFAALLLTAAPALADAPHWQLNKGKSTLGFIAIQNNAPVEGRFTEFTADIRFDPAQPDNSAISAEVEVGSLQTDNDDITTNAKGKDWLGVSEFPKAEFKTTGPLHRMPQSDNYYADASLTLHGKTVPVTLNFQLSQPDDNTAIATGYVTVRRSDFAIGSGEWAKTDVIKNEVRVQFRVVAEK